MSGEVIITILNWDKYQGRAKNYKSMPWLRLDVAILDHPLYENFTASEFKFFVSILLLVAKKKHSEGQIYVTFASLVRQFSLRTCTIRTSLERLKTYGVLEYQEVTHGLRTQRDHDWYAYETERNVTKRDEVLKLDGLGKPGISSEVREQLEKIKRGEYGELQKTRTTPNK